MSGGPLDPADRQYNRRPSADQTGQLASMGSAVNLLGMPDSRSHSQMSDAPVRASMVATDTLRPFGEIRTSVIHPRCPNVSSCLPALSNHASSDTVVPSWYARTRSETENSAIAAALKYQSRSDIG